MIELLLSLTWALSPPALAQSGDWEDHYNQAKLFARKGWYSDAAMELEAALADPGGQTSFDVWWLLTQVRYELLDADGARSAAESAAALDDARASQAAAFAQNLATHYGTLIVESPREGLRSPLQLEREGLLLDPEMKKFIDRVALAWRGEVDLPATVGLPVGSYRVNGHLVEIQTGGTARLSLGMDELGTAALASLQVPRIEIATGVGVFRSARVPNLQPSLETQIGFTYPLNGWLVGAVLDYAVRDYRIVGVGTGSDPWSGSAGLRIGRELYVGGPLALRPSLGYRYGYLPGVPLSCDEVSADGVFLCGDPEETAASVGRVYVVSAAHIPFAELAADYRRAGRTTATGFGVRISVDQAIGQLPEFSEAALGGGGDLTAWRTDDRLWTATGVRLLAEISLTL